MKKITLAAALAAMAITAPAYAAGDNHEQHGPLTLSESSAEDANGFRQKLWAMAPGLVGGRTYVYRNGAREELFTDYDNGTTNDEFDVFCDGADGSDSPNAKIIPERYHGPGTIEVWQSGTRVVSLPVFMCGPTIGVPASSDDPAKANIQPSGTNSQPVPPAVNKVPGHAVIRAGKGSKRLHSRVVRWRIVAKNVGTEATRITVTDRIPANHSLVKLPKGAKLLPGGYVRWTVNIAAGGRKVFGLKTRRGSLTNRCVTNRAVVKSEPQRLVVKARTCWPASGVVRTLPPVTG